jgi:F-type H+-transporting ATPase subunit gamma
MSNAGRAETRLNNIQAVEPILSALRTVSQGSMHAARKKLGDVERYRDELVELITWLPPDVQPSKADPDSTEERVLIVALGSDRGLCGSFNKDTAERLLQQKKEYRASGFEVDVWSLGLRLTTDLERLGLTPDHTERFTRRAVLVYKKADRLAGRMLEDFEQGKYQRVVVMFNDNPRGDQKEISPRLLLPADMSLAEKQGRSEMWPPPIIETDADSLFERILDQVVVIKFYSFLLASSASEHAMRYRLLEDATQNIERLTEELQMDVQRARQQAITTEMSELAAAAGLINK